MNAKFLIFFFFISQVANAQKEPLYILTDKMYNRQLNNDNSANEELNKRAIQLLDELNLSNMFFPLVLDEKNIQPNDNFIKLYSSYNYLTSNHKEILIPRFIVYKRSWQTPYYYSYFIGRKLPSRFNSFNDFKDIKRIYLQSNSMSGYYAPLYKFWEMGFIKNPSVKSLKDELNKEVMVFSNADSVINAVSKDEYAIGATGEEIFSNLNVEIKLVNMVLPQDVICISKNLAPYEFKIDTLISKLLLDSILINKHHFYITHITPFSQTNLNSYNFNEYIIKIVNATKETYSKDVYLSRVIPLNEKIYFKDLIAFMGKSSMSVYLWVFGILLAVYTLGYNTGGTFLPLFVNMKNKFFNLFTYKEKGP
jgi:hypothetical protein